MNELLHFLIADAYADTPVVAAGAPQGGGFSFLIMLGLFFLFAYFVIWRPQNKRAKERQQLLTSLAKGDEVVTAGGFLGTIHKISDQYIVLMMASNVEMVIQKSSIVTILPKGTIKTLE